MGKLEESKAILKALGMPPEQQNDAAAYTLLALAGLGETDPWDQAGQQPFRPHDILQFIRKCYRKRYAENTRETIRRRVLHQFAHTKVAALNPDDHRRPTNSPRSCYALTDEASAVLRSYGGTDFLARAARFQRKQEETTGANRPSQAQHGVPVDLPHGVREYLSPGRHNELQAAVVREFWPRFIRDAELLYLGDTANKSWHVDQATLEQIGMPFSPHEKFPDLVFYLKDRGWLVLVEAVVSHGPFDRGRIDFLEAELLKGCSLHRVCVSAFPTWKEFKSHLNKIAWDTEVWVAEVPEHMIHYNGPKFLGLPSE
jgi:type II restriction enzyme